jgi:hypothetical protein
LVVGAIVIRVIAQVLTIDPRSNARTSWGVPTFYLDCSLDAAHGVILKVVGAVEDCVSWSAVEVDSALVAVGDGSVYGHHKGANFR